MRLSSQALLVSLLAAILVQHHAVVAAKRPNPSRPSSSIHRGKGPPSGRSPPPRRKFEEDVEEEEEELGFPDDFEEEEEVDDYEEEEDLPPPSRRSGPPKRNPPPSRSGSAKKTSSSKAGSKKKGSGPPRSRGYDDEFDRPPPRGSPKRPGGRPGGNVVPYTRKQAPSTFARGLDFVKSAIPDPSAVRDAAVSSLRVARETTSGLSTNLYREVKGLTSSELEQVMLKATRPDDTAVKGKHAERLVGVTYQISSRFDIYDAVLRKLWGKMAEKDWRTTIKALYILHRFSADGAPEHAPALKARLRELRRTRDPKRKDKYFNSKQLLAGDNKPESAGFRAFMARYAHYVLLRAQCFGGAFDEISTLPIPQKDKKTKQAAPAKSITSTCLRNEHLDAAALLLKAGIACQLRDGEECENTAIAAERVVSDLIALTGAVAIALNRALKSDDMKGVDTGLIKKWCEFYGEDLLPKTRSMMKKTAPKLDAFGLFLPSRMSASVSPDLLQKGLKLEESESPAVAEGEEEDAVAEKEESTESTEAAGEEEPEKSTDEADAPEPEEEEATAVDEEAGVYDEYEYEEEEYYDDEEPF